MQDTRLWPWTDTPRESFPQLSAQPGLVCHWQIGIEEGAYGVHLAQEDIVDTRLSDKFC